AQAVVKGDSLHACIGAASILAKVTRDAEMDALAEQYPHYGFASHKGYPTKVHLDALREHGVTPFHRRSYAPVRKIVEELS
ncbi:ribonuclease HII, partial [Litorivivens sp.]